MKRSWTALAVAIAAIFEVAGCNDYGNTFQNNTGALLSFLSPSQISAGGSDFTLTLQGSGFVLKTVVQWNGKTLATTVPVDSTGAALGNVVTATVPAALVAKPGVATVITLNPASGAGNNGLSNPVAFIINPPPNPLPGLTGASPTNAAAGSPPLTLMLNGSSFLPTTDPSGGSQVNWSFNGAQRKLAVLPGGSSSQIQATVTSDLLVNSGSTNLTANVTVFNPPSPAPSGCITACTGGGGGGSSAPVIFTICPSTGCPPGTTAASGAAALVAEETPALSLDGRYVAYTAVQNDRAQIFVRDTCEGAPTSCLSRTTLLSAAADGTPANDGSHAPSMSSDGRYVAFSSAATNLVENAPPGRQVYLMDTCAGAGDSCKSSAQLVSVDPNGALAGSESILPSVSSSGRFIAFLATTPSHSSNPSSTQSTASGTNSGYRQVFIRDTCLGATNCTPKTIRISLQPGDGTGSSSKPAGPALSGDARHVGIVGADAATLFTRSVAVDDRVFLAIANEKH
jgi:WD40-like Beta Propeller Repeat